MGIPGSIVVYMKQNKNCQKNKLVKEVQGFWPLEAILEKFHGLNYHPKASKGPWLRRLLGRPNPVPPVNFRHQVMYCEILIQTSKTKALTKGKDKKQRQHFLRGKNAVVQVGFCVRDWQVIYNFLLVPLNKLAYDSWEWFWKFLHRLKITNLGDHFIPQKPQRNIEAFVEQYPHQRKLTNDWLGQELQNSKWK